MRRVFVLLLLLVVGASYLSHRASASDASSLDGQSVFVDRVIDGDTLVVRADRSVYRLRLRGIDAPNIEPPSHWCENAKRYLEARVGGKPVVLKFDPPQTHDTDGNLLGFAYVNDGECINLSLVRDGQAYADRRSDCFLRSQLEQAETRARQKQTGLWKAIRDDQQPGWRREWLARNRATN